MIPFSTTARTRVRQLSSRGHYDRETIYPIVDKAPFCHVGFACASLAGGGDQPYVIPTLHARDGDELLLHGAPGSRLIQHVQAGHPVCLSFALFDGWVLGKAACSHSMNYRSAILFGRGRLVESNQEKLRAFQLLTERMMPGRWREIRPPDEKELAATAIVSIAVKEASAKVRSGPPRDSRADQALEAWAGVVPMQQVAGTPLPADYTQEDRPLAPSIHAYLQRNTQD